MIKDIYLKDFVEYCKDKFGGNLEAIVIFGSYSLGFFDEEESDYDTIIIFKNKIPKGKNEINKRFSKVTLHHFITEENLSEIIHEGRWSVYITLLKSVKVLYKTKEYDNFLNKLKKINFWKETDNLKRLKFKDRADKEHLKRVKGYKAIKVIYASTRKRLQILTHLRKKKLIWDYNKNLEINNEFFNKEEIIFLRDLRKKNFSRNKDFTNDDKKRALKILDKLILIVWKIYENEKTTF